MKLNSVDVTDAVQFQNPSNKQTEKRRTRPLFVRLSVVSIRVSMHPIGNGAPCFIEISGGGIKNSGSTNKYKKFCHLVIKKLIKIIATRCHISRLKCTKFDSWRLSVCLFVLGQSDNRTNGRICLWVCPENSRQSLKRLTGESDDFIACRPRMICYQKLSNSTIAFCPVSLVTCTVPQLQATHTSLPPKTLRISS